ncbi:hypothetical protein POPTR_019G098950v4 [Populus trichocarpa]|uniref:Uncharacterized protein n=3 Tax=Populus trichocarpa TaxID=3694 RepID=A0ACC0RKU7_POPTR|nr:hypothetical protein POPTR_019G098950v4 [Populus trichocarpa]KAI9377690.1 hypothetical protein POPTR_019G098950v4 [Populus trichocarpa]
MLPVCSATQCCSSHSQGRKTPYLLMSSLRFSEKEMAFLILGEPLGFAMQDRYQRPYLVQGGFQSWVKQGIQVKELKPETVLTILNEGFAAASYALLEWEKTLQFVAIIGISQTWSPGIFMCSRKTGKQPHWFTYITFIFRCSKPGAES